MTGDAGAPAVGVVVDLVEHPNGTIVNDYNSAQVLLDNLVAARNSAEAQSNQVVEGVWASSSDSLMHRSHVP